MQAMVQFLVVLLTESLSEEFENQSCLRRVGYLQNKSMALGGSAKKSMEEFKLP